MNEEALQYSYDLFKKDGYNGSFDDYKKLIKEDTEALDYSYKLFSSDGYDGAIEDFTKLITTEPVKEGAVATETAPAAAVKEAVDTGSTSEDGSLGSQETQPLNSKFEAYFNKQQEDLGIDVPKIKELPVQEQEDFLNATEQLFPGSKQDFKTAAYKPEIKEEAQNIFKNRLKDLKTTDLGTVDFDDKKSIENFRKKSLIDFTSNNPVIQNEIIPKVKKEVEPQINEYVKKSMIKYNLNDPKNITQENLDAFNKDVGGFYNSIINTKIASNQEFKAITNAFDESMNDMSSGYLRDFTKSKDMPLLFSLAQDVKDTWYLNEAIFGTIVKGLTSAVTGYRSMKSSVDETGTNLLIKETTDKIVDFKKNKALASEFGWDDSTEGYFTDDPTNPKSMQFKPKYAKDSRSLDSQGLPVSSTKTNYKPPRSKTITWGDFQNKIKNYTKEKDDLARKNLVEIQNENEVLQNYNDNELDEIFKGNDIVSNLISLSAEQLPQMALSLLTLGATGAVQMGGDIYTQGIDNEARKRFNIPEDKKVSIEQKRDVFLDKDFMDALEVKSVAGGFVTGQLERFGAGKALKPFVTKGTQSVLRTGYKNFLKNSANNLVSNTQNSSIEAITEVAQEIIVAGASGGELSTGQIFDSGATGFLVSMTTGLGGNIKNQTLAEARASSKIIAGKLNPKSSEATFNFKIKEVEDLAKKEIDPNIKKDLIEKRDILIETRNASSSIPKDFSVDSRSKAIDLLVKKKQLEKQIEGVDPEFVVAQKEQINNINKELQQVAIDNRLEKNISSISKIVEDIESVDLKVMEPNELKSFLEKQTKLFNGKTKESKIAEAMASQGFIFQDPNTGKQSIIINKDVARKTRAVNVAGHEFLHALLFETLKNNPEAQKNLGNSLKEYINKIDIDQVKNSEFKRRLQEYNDKPENVQAEEVLTLFSDAIATGDMKFNESIATKIGDIVRRLMQSLGVKIKFNEGKDVYKFIKDYNKSAFKGKLTKSQKEAFKGVKGSLVPIKAVEGDVEVKQSKPSKVADIESQIETLEDKYDDGLLDYDDYEQQLDNLESKLEKAKNAPVEEKVVSKPKTKEAVENTKETIKKASDKVFKETEVSERNKAIAKVNEDIANEMLELGANSISDIKDPAKRKAIVDKLGRNNLGAVTNLTKKAAAVGKDLAIDSNLKIGYDEFFSGFSEELSALIKTYKVKVDGKKVPFGAYMNKNLSLRYGQILDKALKGRVQNAQSLDVEAGSVGSVREIAAEGARDFDAYTSADRGLPAGELIDVTKFRKVKNNLSNVEEVIDLKDVEVGDLTYKKVVDEYAGPVGAAIIGLHDKNAAPDPNETRNKFQKLAERIEGTRTLNYGKETGGEAEVRAMQGLFLDYNDALKFIKTIPEFNVAPFETTIDKQGKSVDLTTDARGYSVGTSNVILKELYDVYIDPKSKSSSKDVKSRSITSPSGRGKGKSSQVAKVYRLKDKYRGRVSRETVKALQKTIGITEAGEAFIPMKGVNRTKFGTALQGLTKIYAANVANTVIRKDIVDKGITSDKKPTEKVLADIGGGKSSVMFSKATDLGLNMPVESPMLGEVLFSKKARAEYESVLKNKRPDLEDPNEQVDNLIKWGDSLDIPDNQKTKYKKLGLYYMANGYVIMPEDGYKVTEAIRLGKANKVDPYSVKNPNELIEKYQAKTKGVRLNPDKVKQFSNKTVLKEGVVVYDVEDSKKGQIAVRKAIDTNWGEKANPWCLAARANVNEESRGATNLQEAQDIARELELDGYTVDIVKINDDLYNIDGNKKVTKENELDKAFKLWKNYNSDGNGFKIAFQNGKLTAFRDGNNTEWWDRMDVNSNNIPLKTVKKGDKKYLEKITEENQMDPVTGESFISSRKIENTLNDRATVVEFYIANPKTKKLKITNKTEKLEIEENIFETTKTEYTDDGNVLSVTDTVENKNRKTYISTNVETLYNEDGSVDAVFRSKTIKGKKFLESERENTRNGEVVFYRKSIELIDADSFEFEDLGVYLYEEMKGEVTRNIDKREEFGFEEGESEYDIFFSKGGEDANIFFSDESTSWNKVFPGFNDTKLDTTVSEAQWKKQTNRYLKQYRFLMEKTDFAKLPSLRPSFFINSKNTKNSNVDAFTPKANLEWNRRAALREAISDINSELNKSKAGFGTPPGKYGRTPEEINKNWENGTIDKLNDKYGDLFDKAWKATATIIRKNPKLAPMLIHMWSSSSYDTAHLNRLGARFIGFDKKPVKADGKDVVYEYEHAVQSHYVAKELIKAAMNKEVDFNTELLKIKENYVMLALSTKDEKKVSDAGYKYYMPKGWKNWWNRYINDKVNAIDGGLNLDNIIILEKINGEKVETTLKDFVQGDTFFSKSTQDKLSKEFNKIIENKTGIKADDTISQVKAKMLANSKRRFNIFIPPSAEDFVGLLYATLGKGKVGDRQMKFYDRVLLKPYARAMQAVTRDRLDLGRSFKNIKKEFNTTPKDLKRKVPGSLFNKEQAVRIYIWDSIGKEVPGLSVDEVNELANYVADNKNLKEFAEQVMRLNPGSKYLSPKEGWETGTITTDLLETLNESRRAKHLERWQQNADAIFTKENLNKLEAVYGTSYRKAMENILTRMKTGRNRTYGTDSQTSKWLDWLNGSVGTIMFFNTRSAILQTLSATNFINFGDNNIFAAGKAFANQKQYWSDFAKLMNSEYLLERRDSLKINVNEADIADAARQRGARGAINYLLKLGFTPTKFADSFAIASGGATFYRNRLNAFIKKGMDPVAAEKAAMRDFIETAEESQQSSRPDKISQEQAGPLGRLVLAFANTPAQYARIIKKAASDLKNGRGDAKTNISKIMYYGVLQNVIFNALQQALFAIAFGDEEDEEMLDDKKLNIANGMLDSFIRGTGILGAVFTMVKNTGIKLYKESEKRNPKYGETAVFEALKISPPISSKASRMRAAGRTLSWEMDEIKEKGVDITNPAVSASASVVSALTNIPLDRVVRKVENLAAASDSELETYKRLALTLGWGKWELGIKEPKKKKKSEKRVSKIKVSGKKYSK